MKNKNEFTPGGGYLVTLSSHLTIASIVNIDSTQATTKTLHVAQIGMRS